MDLAQSPHGQKDDCSHDRRVIGIWTEWPSHSQWANEGMTRLLGFLIEGAAASGRVMFRVVVPAGTRAIAEADLRTLAAEEGRDWTLHAPAPVEADLRTPVDALDASPVTVVSSGRVVRWLRELPPERMGWVLWTIGLAGMPSLILRSALRPLWRLMWRSVVEPQRQRLQLLHRLRQDPYGALPELAAVCERLHYLPGTRRIAADLMAWARERESPRHAVSAAEVAVPCEPEPVPLSAAEQHDQEMRELADFANRYVPVEAWVGLFAHFDHVALLRERKAVVMPDLIPLVFPEFVAELWAEGGPYDLWTKKINRSVEQADRLITFSRHVGRDHLIRKLGISPDRTVTIPHAPPDLRRLLPLDDGRQGNAFTRQYAAELLRQHAARQGWDYLRDFPFEQVPYIVVSTQDRPTKNIGAVAEAFRLLLRRAHMDLKVITTATLVDGATWTQLPGLVERHQLQRDFVSMPRLPREVHAALYHCAKLTIHASIFEGGQGPFPFYESVSVGTPCLMGRGPHVEELLEDEAELAAFVFDPYDTEQLSQLTQKTLTTRHRALDCQLAAFERLRCRTWAHVAEEYAAAALGVSQTRLDRVEAIPGGARTSK